MKDLKSQREVLIEKISRRGLLRYATRACIGVPLMRVLLETDPAYADSVKQSKALFVYYPDGNIADKFFPSETGPSFSLPEITSPLRDFKDKLSLIRGLNMPINGSHEAGAAFCLTGIDKKGVRYSIDSYLGDKFAANAPQKVARLGVAANFQSGSDKYVSYLSTGSLAAVQDSPRVAFIDLFGAGELSPAEREKLNQGRKSILDFARGEISSLKARLGSVEQQKLEDHLTALREMERRLNAVSGKTCRGSVDMRGLNFPENEMTYPKSFELNESFGIISKIMTDLMVSTLACGIAPVGLLQWSHAVSPTVMNFRSGPGVDLGHHDVSHYGSDPNGPFGTKFVACQKWYMDQVAYILKSLDSVRIGDHTLLDETVVMVTTELGDSDRHNFEDIACLIASGRKGRLAMGQAIRENKIPYSRLLVTVLQSLGLSDQTFGDPALGQGPIAALLKS